MSFDTRAGTRGGKVPAGRLVRAFNKLAERRPRRKGGSFMGFRALVLTTTGEVWKRITAAAPRFAQYQEKTDRELPTIRLTPRY